MASASSASSSPSSVFPFIFSLLFPSSLHLLPLRVQHLMVPPDSRVHTLEGASDGTLLVAVAMSQAVVINSSDLYIAESAKPQACPIPIPKRQ